MENGGQIEILNFYSEVDEEGKYIMVSIEEMVEKLVVMNCWKIGLRALRKMLKS